MQSTNKGSSSNSNGYTPTLRSVNRGEDGQSTESEWSDHGWRTSSSTPARPSSSSDDQSANPSPTHQQPPIPMPAPRNIAFSAHSPNNVSHRRQTVTRPSIHASPSNVLLESLTPTLGHTTILNMGEISSPAKISSNGFTQPPSYPEATSSSTYPGHRRERGKSISHAVSSQDRADTETSPDEAYHVNGIITAVGSSSKGKKKRTRTASFSLPFHRRRRMSNAPWGRWYRWLRSERYRRHLANPWSLLCGLLFSVVTLIYLWRRSYELQVEFSVFSHRWVRHEIDNVQPLRGCFNSPHLSPFYDLERHTAPNRQLLTPGVSLKRGTSCYDFSATIQSLPDVPLEPLIYHTYWRSDLIPFGERHTATLMAFLATQPLTHSKLILWTNGVDVVSENTYVRPFLEKWGEYIEVRQLDMRALTRGTELEGVISGIDGGGLFDERGWVDGDAVRLLVLWHHGGVWMDMDQILTRDVHPLTDQEFVTQWDCYDKPYFSLNGALMHFRKHSPYLCEAFHIMASSPLPKPNTFTWGAHLYSKLHRRLLANHQRPFAVLPWCFADPRNCRNDIRFPDPFKPDPDYWGGRRWDGRGEVGRSGKELLEEKVGYVWTIHLHNQWKKTFWKGGWVERLMDGYKAKVDAIERYARSTGTVAGSAAGRRSPVTVAGTVPNSAVDVPVEDEEFPAGAGEQRLPLEVGTEGRGRRESVPRAVDYGEDEETL